MYMSFSQFISLFFVRDESYVKVALQFKTSFGGRRKGEEEKEGRGGEGRRRRMKEKEEMEGKEGEGSKGKEGMERDT